MNDHEAVQRLARLEGSMESMSQALARIEGFIQRVVNPIDRNLAELATNFKHLEGKVLETREQGSQCADAHKAASKMLGERIDAVHEKASALENRSTGALRMAMWFCAVFSGAAIAAGGWLFSQVGEGSRVNAVQQQRIEQLERQVLELRQDIRAPAK